MSTDESLSLDQLLPRLSSEDVLQALEAEDIPESFRKNVREEGDTRKVQGMCLGVTSHWTKGATVSAATRLRPALTALLCRFARQELAGFEFTSIQVNKDYKAAMHVDKNNLGPSFILGLGDYSGGWLWIDDGSNLGHAKNIRRRWFKFDGTKPHCVTPFCGRRYTLVFFTYSNPQMVTSLSEKEESRLCQLGFPLPAEAARCKNLIRESPTRVCRCLPSSRPHGQFPAALRVQKALHTYKRFELEVARRGGLGRRPQRVQVGLRQLEVMVEPSMPVYMLSTALSQSDEETLGKKRKRPGETAPLFAGSLKLLGTDRLKRLGLRGLLKAA
ncbi:unnamed protein product [Effrenium voratum]|nr:unnamed protein product [Effrenium voratum]